jgi:hypothetical protein
MESDGRLYWSFLGLALLLGWVLIFSTPTWAQVEGNNGRVAHPIEFILLRRVPRPSFAWAGFFVARLCYTVSGR